MALVRLEIDATVQCITEKRYPIFLAVGSKRIEIANFTNIPTCRYYCRQAYKRFNVAQPDFETIAERIVAPWFEL